MILLPSCEEFTERNNSRCLSVFFLDAYFFLQEMLYQTWVIRFHEEKKWMNCNSQNCDTEEKSSYISPALCASGKLWAPSVQLTWKVQLHFWADLTLTSNLATGKEPFKCILVTEVWSHLRSNRSTWPSWMMTAEGAHRTYLSDQSLSLDDVFKVPAGHVRGLPGSGLEPAS